MPRPTDEELDTAIQKAIEMREENNDPFNLAKCLLSHNFRMRHLQEVLVLADRYINMGMSDQERTFLISAIDKAKNVESYTAQEEQARFGLE